MPYKLKRVKKLGEIRRFINEPYNLPDIRNPEDKEKFADEYEEYDEMVRSKLDVFGDIDAFGDAPFSMGDPWGGSRCIGIVLNNEEFYGEEVLAALWEGLQTMPLSYLLQISGDAVGGNFYILIDKDTEILGYSPYPAVLDAFGFPR